MRMLYMRSGRRIVASFLSMLIVLFGAGFETIEACCRSFCQGTAMYSSGQGCASQPESEPTSDCCQATCECCDSHANEAESEGGGCTPTIVHHCLDRYTPAVRHTLPPVFMSAYSISALFSFLPDPILPASTPLLSGCSPPPPVKDGRATLGDSCILII